MTRIQDAGAFLLALLSAACLACGQAKVPADAPATTPATERTATDAGIEALADDGADAGVPDDASADTGTTDAAGADPSPTGGADSYASTDGPAATDDLCLRFCAVLLATACPPDAAACQAGCMADLGGGCAAEARADDACEAKLTAAAFTCDSRGRIRLNPGSCDDEETKLGDCLLAQ